MQINFRSTWFYTWQHGSPAESEFRSLIPGFRCSFFNMKGVPHKISEIFNDVIQSLSFRYLNCPSYVSLLFLWSETKVNIVFSCPHTVEHIWRVSIALRRHIWELLCFGLGLWAQHFQQIIDWFVFSAVTTAVECVWSLFQSYIHVACVSLTIFLFGNRAQDAASWEMNQQKFRYCCSVLFLSTAFCPAEMLLGFGWLFYRRLNVLVSFGKLFFLNPRVSKSTSGLPELLPAGLCILHFVQCNN